MPVTNSRAIRNLRLSLALSDRQRNILVGSLLGDGCLIPNSWNRHYRLQIEQNSAHKGYVFWLYREFRSWVLAKPTYHSTTQSWKFRTISHPELTNLAQEFYVGRTKTLPMRIRELLNHPLSLAIWAMDDGCLMARGDGFTFNTQSFTREENQLLRDCLAENFGLTESSLHRDKSHVRLYIRLGSLQRLRKLIEPHLLAEFTYKLPKPRRDLFSATGRNG